MVTVDLAESSNVVRFPGERRATLDVLRGIAPDGREVSLLGETYEIAVPADLQEHADRAAAEYILNQVPTTGRERDDMLREMLNHAVSTAVTAVLVSQRITKAAVLARAEAAEARAGLGYWLYDLEQRAAELSIGAAEALISAHGRTLEAYGVARAVDLAFRGVEWAPRNHRAEMEWLLSVEAKRRTG